MAAARETRRVIQIEKNESNFTMPSETKILHSVTVFEFVDQNGELGFGVTPEGSPSMMQMIALLEMGKIQLAHNRTLNAIRGT